MTSERAANALDHFEKVLRSTERRHRRTSHHTLERLEKRARALKKQGNCGHLTSKLDWYNDQIDLLEVAIAKTELRIEETTNERKRKQLLATLTEQEQSKQCYEEQRLAAEWKSALLCREYDVLETQIEALKESEEELEFFEREFWRLLCESKPNLFRRLLCELESELTRNHERDEDRPSPPQEPTRQEELEVLLAEKEALAATLEDLDLREQALDESRSDLVAQQQAIVAEIATLEEKKPKTKPKTKKKAAKRPASGGRPS